MPEMMRQGQTHFCKERVIVMYVGDDREMLRILVDLFRRAWTS
jgi:hypothetical protein